MSKKDLYAVDVRGVSLTYQIKASLSLKKLFTRTESVFHTREIEAVKDVSFSLLEGENLGMVGTNGSGKSTLLRLIARTYKPDKGTIDLNVQKVQLLTLGSGFMDDLTGRDNLYLNALLLGLSEGELDQGLADEIIAFSELKEFIDLPMYTYSSGMRSRLTFSVAACIQPDLLLLDEVFSVGDAHFIQKSSARLNKMIKSENSVIMISHNINDILQNCTKVLWLDRGCMKMFGDVQHVVKEYNEFIKHYGDSEG